MATFEELVDERVKQILPDLLKPYIEKIELLEARPSYKKLLTTKEAEEFLGVKDDTLTKYFKQGLIGRKKIGRNNFYELSTLEAYLERLKIKSEVLTDRLAKISA